MKILYLPLSIICLLIGSSLQLTAQISTEDRLSTQSPYIEDSRAVKLIGIHLTNIQNHQIEIDGQSYPCFAEKTAALDFFKNMNEHQDYMVIYINDSSFGEETHEIRRQILRKAYYDTPMDREIFSIHQID